MSSENEIDLNIALQMIHELASAEGDLGREYWNQIATLLKRASGMRSEINALSQELELCRARRQRNSAARGRGVARLKRLVRKPPNPVSIDDMTGPPLPIDEVLLARAQALTGLPDKTSVLQQALLALIEQISSAD